MPAQNGISIDSDPTRLDLVTVHGFLASSYWAKGVPLATLERAVAGSLCFGVYDGRRQVGFARVITDSATFAYLADVFILPSHRGRGLGKQLMETIVAHPSLQGLRRWVLVTQDAHGLYARFGFTPLATPQRYMERHDPTVYGGRGER